MLRIMQHPTLQSAPSLPMVQWASCPLCGRNSRRVISSELASRSHKWARIAALAMGIVGPWAGEGGWLA
jgi:4-hydroxy-3-methylbut-2-en-1-yl diphosphate synthase IspG/GcpE